MTGERRDGLIEAVSEARETCIRAAGRALTMLHTEQHPPTQFVQDLVELRVRLNEAARACQMLLDELRSGK